MIPVLSSSIHYSQNHSSADTDDLPQITIESNVILCLKQIIVHKEGHHLIMSSLMMNSVTGYGIWNYLANRGTQRNKQGAQT